MCLQTRFSAEKEKRKEKLWFLKSHSTSKKWSTETRGVLLSLDLMTLFAWLAILQHPQLWLPAGTAETEGTACTSFHFPGRATDQTTLLFSSCSQGSWRLCFCCLSLLCPWSFVLFSFYFSLFHSVRFSEFCFSFFPHVSHKKNASFILSSHCWELSKFIKWVLYLLL